jgi:hypothetical protein
MEHDDLRRMTAGDVSRERDGSPARAGRIGGDQDALEHAELLLSLDQVRLVEIAPPGPFVAEFAGPPNRLRARGCAMMWP